jgi:MarR family 2-MHQ and catechol resistance regulon transcriptional repressor
LSMAERLSRRERMLRAFRVYLDLLDAATYMRGWMRGPLELFDLTMLGFRVLVILYEEGPTQLREMAEKLQCRRQNVGPIVKRLEERGLVRGEAAELPLARIEATRIARAKRGQARKGRRVTLLRLTPKGKKLIGNVLPRHAKVVRALMRALEARELATLSRLLEKLREGDILRFTREMEHRYVGEGES